jgi:hypothetical protein
MRWASRVGTACVVAAFAMVTAALASTSVNIELRGFGESIGSTAACPDGRTLIPIIHSRRSVLYCVTSARKLTKPGLDPWRIIETVRGTIRLSGGTLRTSETQTFTFTRSGTSTATFRGRVAGGTGRYAGSTGTVSGSGTGRNSAASWRVTFLLR